MAANFEIYTSKNGEYRFRLKAANGEIILQSEGYTRKQNCQNGVESVRRNAADDNNFIRLTAKNGKPYFNLKSHHNGQIIGTSEMYNSEQARENGIASVMKNAEVAGIKTLD